MLSTELGLPPASAPADPVALPPAPTSFEGLASVSPSMHVLFSTCARIAPTSAAVLIQGETGTGKERIARAIHRLSGRKGRFVAMDCGAVPSALIDSELFGHERGAFTGASERKPGLFRRAHRGTLLLDELGNMPVSAQCSLLRVLQERAIRPLGGADEVEVDARVIAATSCDLHAAVREGTLREDLLYRLDVIRIQPPPLRERPEDVPHLLQLFLERASSRHLLESPRLGPGFLLAAMNHSWPGNVRQLENLAERLLLTRLPCVSEGDFIASVRPRLDSCRRVADRCADRCVAERARRSPVDVTEQSLRAFLAAQEAGYLRALLRETRGSLRETSQRAELVPRTLRRKLKRHGIDRAGFLG